MKINEIKKLKEKEHIVLLPKHDYDIKKSTEYSFKNVISLEEELSEDDIKQIIDTVNEKNVQLIHNTITGLNKKKITILIFFLKDMSIFKW